MKIVLIQVRVLILLEGERLSFKQTRQQNTVGRESRSRRVRGHLEVIEDLQHCGQRPGLGFTAEGAVLAVLIGQLWETLPWRPAGEESHSHTATLKLTSQLSLWGCVILHYCQS